MPSSPVVDRQLSLVSSYNLDPRSERLNSESAIVESTVLAERLAQIFLQQDSPVSDDHRRLTVLAFRACTAGAC